MRNLETDDLFLLVDIVDSLGVDELVEAISGLNIDDYKAKDENGKLVINEEKWGQVLLEKLAVYLIRNINNCREPLYRFLASLKGVKAEEIGKQSPVQTVKDIKELLGKEEFKDLFTVALESHK